jgi:hypothetical protein
MKGWRTIAWNAVNAVVLTLEIIPNAPYQMPESWEPMWLAVYIVGNVYLRFITTTPVGRPK